MISFNRPLGIIDTGVGGLTIVKEIQKLMPAEDIVYFGDSLNCPYGNKTTYEIENLSKNMLNFMEKSNVKVLGIACNTISAISDSFSRNYNYEIIDIISPAIKNIVDFNYKNIGLIATDFTIKSGIYEKKLCESDASITIMSIKSKKLAKLIDSGEFDYRSIEREIKESMYGIISDNIEVLILGCTHYPIVIDIFQKLFPSIQFFDPAVSLANKIMERVRHDGFENKKKTGNTIIYTTGSSIIYQNVAKKLGVNITKVIEV